MNTFLRWAGSKRKLLPALRNAMPKEFDRYVEPFSGSACLFFELEPSRALLGDINADLINTYRALKSDVAAVIRHLASYKKGERAYYRARSLNPQRLSPAGRAARFIYLNRFCFNGLYRTNGSGWFNVPYGGEKAGALPTAKTLRACAKSLRRATVSARSFEETLGEVRAGDFVYLDPPYSIRSRRVFNEYSHFSFGSEELRLLRAHLVRLDRTGIPFLVSYGVSREAGDLATGFRRREIVVQRQIAGFATRRRKSRELLITNY